MIYVLCNNRPLINIIHILLQSTSKVNCTNNYEYWITLLYTDYNNFENKIISVHFASLNSWIKLFAIKSPYFYSLYISSKGYKTIILKEILQIEYSQSKAIYCNAITHKLEFIMKSSVHMETSKVEKITEWDKCQNQ